MTKKQLDVDTLARYLGPAMVHPIEYWCKIWRIFDEKGKGVMIKCTEANKCNMYYTDSEGIEHRDAIYDITQLPIAYRTEKVAASITKNINAQTILTYETVVVLFGEPRIDPDIPFIYDWYRGDYHLQMVGKVFSVAEVGRDDRSTVTYFGQLPMSFRAALNTQSVKGAYEQVPIQMPNPEEVLKSTPASEAAMKMESSPNPVASYAENPNPVPANYQGPGSGSPVSEGKGYMMEHLDGVGSIVSDDDDSPPEISLPDEAYTPSFAENSPLMPNKKGTVADDDFDLNSTLKQFGVVTTNPNFDPEHPDDDDSFKANPSNIAAALASRPQPNRKEMNPTSGKINENPDRPMTLEAWEGVRDGKCPDEIVSMRRKVRAAKAAATRAKKKAANAKKAS